MLFLLGVLFMVVGVGLSIALHELGHMLPAKRFGVRVSQYMIGFGPTLFSRRRGETEYGFKAIPLGGYVRMIGMYPPKSSDPAGSVRSSSTGRLSQLADEVRAQSYEEMRPGDENRVFYKLKTWQKVVVMFGGPFMNLVIATVVLLVMVCGIGLPQTHGTKVAGMTTCLKTLSKGETCPADKKAPASTSGLRLGDTIESIDGQRVTGSVDATRIIRAHGGQPLPVVVDRGGKKLTLTVTPKETQVIKTDASGNEVRDSSGRPKYTTGGYVGLSIGTTRIVRGSPVEAFKQLGTGLKQTSMIFVNLPNRLKGVYDAAFTNKQRSPDSMMSVVGVTRIAGDVAESNGVAFKQKILLLLSLLMSLNLALFVFNLVPLMPLDGGHIAGALWEALKRAIARAKGVTTPVYADVTKALPVAYAMSILLIAMSVLLVYADIVKPVSLGG